jgi:hypothetical protein
MALNKKRYAIEIIEDEDFEQVVDQPFVMFVRSEWDLLFEWIRTAAAHIEIPYPDISLWHLSIRDDDSFDG